MEHPSQLFGRQRLLLYGLKCPYTDPLERREPRHERIRLVWYGMVWYGMVWYGMVWYGMVWYGTMRKKQTDKASRVLLSFHIIQCISFVPSLSGQMHRFFSSERLYLVLAASQHLVHDGVRMAFSSTAKLVCRVLFFAADRPPQR